MTTSLPKLSPVLLVNLLCYRGTSSRLKAVIAADAASAYLYAKSVLYARWPEGEAAIMKDPKVAFSYARYIIRGRWPEAEATILTEPMWAYQYAVHVIKGPWPELLQRLRLTHPSTEPPCPTATT